MLFIKGTWKDWELFPACSAALFQEDVMVPLGGRRSHSCFLGWTTSAFYGWQLADCPAIVGTSN